MRALLIVLCVLLFSPLSRAAEPYGRDFVLLADLADAFEPPGAAEAPPPEDLRAHIRDLEQRLQEQRNAGGPYAPAQAETLGDLARLLEQTGRGREALELREKALHLVRVNDGLYSPTQAPFVREILEALRRSGDLPALDDRYNYFFRLYGSGRPPWDDRRWKALLEYVDWQREALAVELDGGDPRDRLLELYDLLDDVQEALLTPADGILKWRRLVDTVHARLAVFYLLEDLVQPQEDFRSIRGDIRRFDDPGEFDLRRERLENLHRSLKSRGKSIIEEALMLVPPQAFRERMELELALADWLQWYGTTREARQRYLTIWKALRERGDDATIARWFSGPRPLPADGAFRSAGDPSESLLVNVSVSESGRGRGAAEQPPEGQKRAIGRLTSYIANTRFRPRIVDGEVVEARYENVPWVLLYR